MQKSLLAKLAAGALNIYLSRQLALADKNKQAQHGDVIKVNRGAYDHYGVYALNNDNEPSVIHYTGATGPADFNGMVRETSLEEFLNGAKSFTVCSFPDNDEININNKLNNNSPLSLVWQEVKKSLHKDYHLYSGSETVARARSQLGRTGYNLICNNCEHFAVWCKTGVKESSQVNKIIDLLVALSAKR
ncbi:MAG: lecithin retinol acyltransferase family protein [Synergistaceae bacterium]|nr:lecithin retinol acyltransferase family protein [Synergistaceae bacterium]MBR1604137.1 lecithin retinol acyltransferase family protein [Synergistaceae bacterium]